MMRFKGFGELHKYENFLIFFGNRTATLEDLHPHFPTTSILKQTHSDKLVKADSTRSTPPEADAQWTDQKNISPVIKTADCLPVIVCSPQKKVALGIHSGWRGVLQKITSKSIAALSLQDDPKLKVFIGPHIQHKSFEVDRDVALSILSAHDISYAGGEALSPISAFPVFMENKKSEDLVFEKNGKFYVNLSALVRWELLRLHIPPHQLFVSDRDTKLDTNYFSYRRGEKGVSNYSLVTQL
jgi:polyphenol oxidase